MYRTLHYSYEFSNRYRIHDTQLYVYDNQFITAYPWLYLNKNNSTFVLMLSEYLSSFPFFNRKIHDKMAKH